MKKIGIIGAMEVEVEFLKNLMGENSVQSEFASLVFFEGTINGTNVVVVKSGIGKVNAALCAQTLINRFSCTHIINTGIAGAAEKSLSVMDFVVSTDAVYHDFDTTAFGYKKGQIPQMNVFAFNADEKMISAVKKAFAESEFASEHKILSGRIASGDQFIDSAAEKQRIIDEFSPFCVEMEGAAVAHACYLNRIPFAIIRCMSDMADESHVTQYSFNEDTAATMSAKLVQRAISYID